MTRHDSQKKKGSKAPYHSPRIYEAKLGSGPSGVVVKGREIDLQTAIAERRAGRDIVVCGNDVDANRRQAQAIEAAVGLCKRHDPHAKAGPRALPHYQQDMTPPNGHSFYE